MKEFLNYWRFINLAGYLWQIVNLFSDQGASNDKQSDAAENIKVDISASTQKDNQPLTDALVENTEKKEEILEGDSYLSFSFAHHSSHQNDYRDKLSSH